MIRRFIKLNTFTALSGKFIENERMFLLSKIHSVTTHHDFDDALMLWDSKGIKICEVRLTMEELISLMNEPIEIEI